VALDQEDVLAALRRVIEPQLRRDIIDLGLVRSVHGEGKRIEVAIAHPGHAYPDPERLESAIKDEVGAIKGVKAVTVTADVLSEEEQEALRRQLIGDPGATAGQSEAHGHAEGRAVRFADPDNRTRCILVASGKGGVGKSTLTVNLAVALAQQGKRVAVVDADVWGFSVPAMLGIRRPPFVVDRMLVPPEIHGVRCISMGFFTEEDQAVIWRGPMLHKALEQFLTDVWWDEPDVLLVDLPPGTGDISISLAGFLPRGEVLLVTTPQPASQRVAQRAGVMAGKVNLQLLGVVENMAGFTTPDGAAYPVFGEGGGQLLADTLGTEVIGRIPLTMGLREGGDSGRPVSAVAPDDPAARAIRETAEWIDAHPPKRVYRSELKIV